MKKTSLDELDDGFINVYEEGIFVKSFEYSAIFIAGLTGYRLFANIDKKTGFIFLECSFPKTKFEGIQNKVEEKGYSIRFISSDGNIHSTFGKQKLQKDTFEIIKTKQQLTKFSYDNI